MFGGSKSKPKNRNDNVMSQSKIMLISDPTENCSKEVANEI